MKKLWLVIMSLTLVLILGGPGCKKAQEETGVKMKEVVRKEGKKEVKKGVKKKPRIKKTEKEEMLRDTTVKGVD